MAASRPRPGTRAYREPNAPLSELFVNHGYRFSEQLCEEICSFRAQESQAASPPAERPPLLATPQALKVDSVPAHLGFPSQTYQVSPLPAAHTPR